MCSSDLRVLPSRFPNLLVNGSAGIAVGMATNIPPHNLREVIDATICVLDDPNATLADLMEYVKGPDFPTRGIIMGRSGIRQAYDDAPGGEVRPLDVLHQITELSLRIVQHADAGADHLPQVVGRDIGGHAHRDAAGAVHQQIGKPGGQEIGRAHV